MDRRGGIGRVLAALAVGVAASALAAGCGSTDAAEDTTTTTAATTATSTTQTTPAGAETLAQAVAAVRRQLAGVRQRDLTLGPVRAPVTIIEYAGFDCAACAEAHQTVVPALIDRYVRTGKASLELRVLAAGSHDLALALGVHAARPQRLGWQMAQLEYRRAATADPTSPLAAAETPSVYARALGIEVPRWKRDLERPRWAADLQAALSVFKVAKWGQTPVFLVRRIGLDVPFEVVSAPTSIDELDRAIEAALGR